MLEILTPHPYITNHGDDPCKTNPDGFQMNGPHRPEFPPDQLRGTYPIVCFDDLTLEPPNASD